MRTPPLTLAAVLGLALLLAACERVAQDPTPSPGPDAAPDTTPPDREYLTLGQEITAEGLALSPADLAAAPTTYQGQSVRVEGTVTNVCNTGGCWLALDNPGGPPVRVLAPEDGAGVPAWTFTHPVTGVQAVVEGTATADTISAADLRRYAEAAGRPQGEIDAITQGEQTASIVARGIRFARGTVLPAGGTAPPADGLPPRDATEATQPDALDDRPEPRTPSSD